MRTAFPLGVSTSIAPSIRSEYFNTAAYASSNSLARNYVEAFLESRCDQLYLPDILQDSPEYDLWKTLSDESGFDFIVKDINPTYGVDVSCESFDVYLSGLGSNTRLKLYNRRKNLHMLGEVKVENLWPDQEYFYKLINDFHQKRWGRDCYQGRNLTFIRLLLDNLVHDGHEVNLSLMTVNKKPVSVVLDIQFNGRIYNLQSGYLEGFAKNISLGTLHLGYQLESAFSRADVDFYDFMAGKGKNADYKSALSNRKAAFNTLLLVRNPVLKILYRMQRRFNPHN
ncbi:hypothetical protein GCM10011613_28870 [Cellvibrio zantedeschiae]|uniref:BioF2-like acetyltransferase domain-containing protein n=1 Tax=Cellvibrio zantedeschiae TaxID=1237077 RepID=A0ABQ3B787_9GAMM|nr:hypothetical protein GCM10011613_28870 [Cellvibrio zantedeschiae]